MGGPEVGGGHLLDEEGLHGRRVGISGLVVGVGQHLVAGQPDLGWRGEGEARFGVGIHLPHQLQHRGLLLPLPVGRIRGVQ